MQITWLGWAGVEIAAQGERVVIDPLADPLAVFAWLGERAHAVPLPEVVAPRPGAIAGLVTHLHRDHADADALTAALAASATLYEPLDYGGQGAERLALLQADQELAAADLARQPTGAWTSITAGPFTLTALPAVDGTGDPQVSWLIEADGERVLHLGDTIWHGWWWRIAERYGAPDVLLAPINGPRVNFPHRQPASHLPAAMEPEQAALAAQLLGADRLVHAGRQPQNPVSARPAQPARNAGTQVWSHPVDVLCGGLHRRDYRSPLRRVQSRPTRAHPPSREPRGFVRRNRQRARSVLR